MLRLPSAEGRDFRGAKDVNSFQRLSGGSEAELSPLCLTSSASHRAHNRFWSLAGSSWGAAGSSQFWSILGWKLIQDPV